jgi:FkbM family methyltransferase
MLDVTLVRIGQLIGKPPGWERVVRALAPPMCFANSGVRGSPQPDGYVFPVDRGTLLGWSVHFFGTYEPEVQTEIRRYVTPGAIAIDVGANVGWHTLLMAARAGSTGRVYAFEPNDSTRQRLVSAVEANDLAQVTVDGRAVADLVGARGFQAPLAGHVWDGTGRLIAAQAQDGRDERGKQEGQERQEGRERQEGQEGQEGLEGQEGREGQERQTTRIECTTLDAFVAERHIERLALVKIDVEGWELSVLRGARHVLSALRPVVVFEYDPAYVSRSGGAAEDLTRCWSNADYELFALDPRHPPARLARLGDRGGNFLALPRRAAGVR